MDLIKETYEILNRHLGVEHRGRIQLGNEHEELKKEVQNLVLYALHLGKVIGAQDVRSAVATKMDLFYDCINDKCNELTQEFYKEKVKGWNLDKPPEKE